MGFSKAQNLEDGSLNRLTFNLSNSGVGPAIVTDVRIKYKGKVATDWWHLFELQEIPDSIETYIGNQAINGQIVKIGEALVVLNLDHNLPLANAFFHKLDGLEIGLYYESIYGEVWKYDGETTEKMENFTGVPDEEQFDG